MKNEFCVFCGKECDQVTMHGQFKSKNFYSACFDCYAENKELDFYRVNCKAGDNHKNFSVAEYPYSS